MLLRASFDGLGLSACVRPREDAREKLPNCARQTETRPADGDAAPSEDALEGSRRRDRSVGVNPQAGGLVTRPPSDDDFRSAGAAAGKEIFPGPPVGSALHASRLPRLPQSLMAFSRDRRNLPAADGFSAMCRLHPMCAESRRVAKGRELLFPVGLDKLRGRPVVVRKREKGGQAAPSCHAAAWDAGVRWQEFRRTAESEVPGRGEAARCGETDIKAQAAQQSRIGADICPFCSPPVPLPGGCSRKARGCHAWIRASDGRNGSLPIARDLGMLASVHRLKVACSQTRVGRLAGFGRAIWAGLGAIVCPHRCDAELSCA